MARGRSFVSAPEWGMNLTGAGLRSTVPVYVFPRAGQPIPSRQLERFHDSCREVAEVARLPGPVAEVARLPGPVAEVARLPGPGRSRPEVWRLPLPDS
jgi:hypothetical protein